MAAYYYGIELYKASVKGYDGEVDSKKVQIKISQQDKILISQEPEYLIVLYLRKNGDIFEVYNGPGKQAWDNAGKMQKNGQRPISLSKLKKLALLVEEKDKIL